MDRKNNVQLQTKVDAELARVFREAAEGQGFTTSRALRLAAADFAAAHLLETEGEYFAHFGTERISLDRERLASLLAGEPIAYFPSNETD